VGWIGKGIFKADDYYHLGRLVDRLFDAGAVAITMSYKKNRIYVVVPMQRTQDVENILLQEDYEFTKKPGLKGKVFIYAVRW